MSSGIRGVYEYPKESGKWCICYFQDGKRHREVIGKKSDAIAAYQQIKTRQREWKLYRRGLRPSPLSVGELIDDAILFSKRYHSSLHAQNCSYQHDKLREWFGDQQAISITPQQIENKFAELNAAGLNIATVNRYRARLSHVFTLGIRNRKITENPVAYVPIHREDNSRVRFLTEKEEKQLRKQIRETAPEHEPELDLALHTGMRRGEQYRLTWEDVDLTRGIITLRKTKNGETRHIPINSHCRAALDKLKHGSTGMYVSLGYDGIRKKDQREWFEDAVEKAGIPNFHYHDLRHTFASRLVMAAVEVRTVQELLGHKSIEMTQRYSHLSDEHKRAAIEKLCAKTDPEPVQQESSGRPFIVRSGGAK